MTERRPAKTLIAVRLDGDLVEALARYRRIERVAVTDQIDLALRAWFKAKRHPVGTTRSARGKQ